MDTATPDEQRPVDVWVLFRELPESEKISPLWKLLKPGFAHCEVWRHFREVWLRCEPCLEMAELEVYADPPWKLVLPELRPTFLRVQRSVPYGKVRDVWQFGPCTCVELTKAFLGICAPFVRTPYQLYRYLKKNEQVSQEAQAASADRAGESTAGAPG